MEGATQGAGIWGNILGNILILGAFLVVAYLLLIRPQQQERKKQQEMMSSLRKGNHVVLVSGVYGEIVDIKDNVILVNIADDPNKEMIVRYSKFAVQSKLGVDNTPEKDKAVAEKDKK